MQEKEKELAHIRETLASERGTIALLQEESNRLREDLTAAQQRANVLAAREEEMAGMH